jgi:hypothetical protein
MRPEGAALQLAEGWLRDEASKEAVEAGLPTMQAAHHRDWQQHVGGSHDVFLASNTPGQAGFAAGPSP